MKPGNAEPSRPPRLQRGPGPWIALVAAAVVALVPGCRPRGTSAPRGELHVGYMICNSLAETRERFEPLNSYLSDTLGLRIVPYYINTSQFEKELQKGYLQVAHTNSLLYVIFRENYRWNLLAGEKEGSHGSATAGVIFVPSESPVRTVADLKGKRMMFGPELAPMGFLSQYDLLLREKLDPELDLASYSFTRGAFTHEKVVYAVLFGGWDAGAVPLLDLEKMEREGKIQPGDLRVVATGPFIPYCTFSTSPDLPADTRAALERAILGLTRDVTARVGSEILGVLGRAGVDGFEKLDDSAYEPIREMARRANMPPYQKY